MGTTDATIEDLLTEVEALVAEAVAADGHDQHEKGLNAYSKIDRIKTLWRGLPEDDDRRESAKARILAVTSRLRDHVFTTKQGA